MKQAHTPLYDAHRAHGAKLVDFAGWHMPLQYTGVIDEYHAVRGQAGLFDVSHMGRIAVSGKGALPFLQMVMTNDVANLEIHRSNYSMICNPAGGIKDDVFIYRLGWQDYLVCVNASNRGKILKWLQEQRGDVQEPFQLQDRSEEIAQLALQGPVSKTILAKGIMEDVDSLRPRGCLETKLFGVPILLTRTGYTGELGFELYIPANEAKSLWDQLMEVGQSEGLKPAGLGARDLLRLDMGYFLYGNDLTEDTTPVEAGATWVVAFDKEYFIGSDVLKKQKQEGSAKRLVAFELLEKAVPRQGMTVFANELPTGNVTSGNLSPILQKGIGLGYVASEYGEIGGRIEIDIRGRRVTAVIVKPPFYKRKG